MECSEILVRIIGIYVKNIAPFLASSLFTVYMSASQEGWVYVLYDTLDSFPSYIAFFYFVTLIG